MKRSIFSAWCIAAAVAPSYAAEPPTVSDSSAFDPSRCLETERGASFHIDNDLFAGSPHDSDYTGGMSVHWTPADQRSTRWTHRLHAATDRLLGLGVSPCRRYVWQLGLYSLTPGTLRSNVPVLNDRPFASLLVLGTTATWPGATPDVSYDSTLQFAALGLNAAGEVHRWLHRLVGDEQPMGYQYQVSEGGEPTLRYMLGRHTLLRDGVARGETLQLKRTLSLSVGYLTEASFGWSGRWGRIDSPWQAFTPELADYLPTPFPRVALRPGSSELFAFAGARIRVRAYNALSQGQFRDSVHVLHSSDLEPLLAEAWIGVRWRPSDAWAITYTLRANTPELRDDPSRRSMIWAGFEMSRRF